VQQILDFGRRAIIQPQPLDLASFLFDQVKMLRRTIPENIQINLAVANEACIVSVDPNRFQQMITNLALNARDAMPIGGHLAIQVKRHHFIHDDETPLTDMPAGNWVQITFHDSGDGIEPEVLPHIFEPFFTTKAPGKGNGLGLAQVYGIVKQHNGYIDVQSAVGQGSTFMIYLPALGQNDTTISPTQPQTLPKGNGETVLIVEDNGVLREALIATVEMMNYSTKTAANGMEALNLLQEPSQNIAVVISDMVMPELGGDALFEAMQLRGLKTPMIILSGHPLDTEFVEILTAKGLVGFLMKPLDLKRLALLIDQAIQQAAA
jgi:CheY-like chemotaxis protein